MSSTGLTCSPLQQQWIAAQGYQLDAKTLASLARWIRFTPSVCALVIGLGLAAASPAALGVVSVLGYMGALLPRSPYDLLYEYGIRRLIGAPSLPPNPPGRRFSCGLAATFLLGAAIAFAGQAAVWGYILGGIVFVSAGLSATTYFCLGAFIYRWVFARSKAIG